MRKIDAAIDTAIQDEEERKLLKKAVRRCFSTGGARLGLDFSPVRRVQAAAQNQNRGTTFRSQDALVNRIVLQNPARLAFAGLSDRDREEYSRFCRLMFDGYMERFLNRHPGEDPEDYLERPRKQVTNLTRLVVGVLSGLYKQEPVRQFESSNAAAQERLPEVWSNLFNLTLLEVDRLTRLLGTVAVRPFYDPSAPGGIRLWVLESHKLRVILDTKKPWEVAAVIERHAPFVHGGGMKQIWTAKSFMVFDGRKTIEIGSHDMGRVPHVFFRDRLSFDSFFVEGIGRGLCNSNALINDKLSDLNEIVQMQGFSVTELVNPEEDDPGWGPREAVVFRPEEGQPYGVHFKNPGVDLPALAADVAKDIRQLFREYRIPDASIGIDLGRRAVSGVAIKISIAPILEQQEERARLFSPQERELADVSLRVLNEYDKDFSWDPGKDTIKFGIQYPTPEIPKSVDEQLKRDEFDVAQGVITPVDIIIRNDPTRFANRDEATELWRKNLAETSSGIGRTVEDIEADEDKLNAPDQAPPGSNGNGTDVGDAIDLYLEVEEARSCPT